jgi:hypothetical protein
MVLKNDNAMKKIVLLAKLMLKGNVIFVAKAEGFSFATNLELGHFMIGHDSTAPNTSRKN